jgi:hypothetical protein
MTEYFVLQIVQNKPHGLMGPLSFEEAKKTCEEIAREDGATEYEIKKEIIESDEPGLFYSCTNDSCSVWVVPANR